MTARRRFVPWLCVPGGISPLVHRRTEADEQRRWRAEQQRGAAQRHRVRRGCMAAPGQAGMHAELLGRHGWLAGAAARTGGVTFPWRGVALWWLGRATWLLATKLAQ